MNSLPPAPSSSSVSVARTQGKTTVFSSNSDKRTASNLERITIVFSLAAVLPYTKSEDRALRGGKEKKMMTAQEKNVEREEIKQQLYRYCHAVDRIDYELGRSVFAEDAVVDYGPTYQGSGKGYIDTMLKTQHKMMLSTHHMVTNVLVEFNEDGTKAASEAYVSASCKYKNKAGKPSFTVEAHCRDIDQWEKRDGTWLIVKRVVAGDNTYIVRPEYLDDYNNSRGKKADPADQFFASLKD